MDYHLTRMNISLLFFVIYRYSLFVDTPQSIFPLSLFVNPTPSLIRMLIICKILVNINYLKQKKRQNMAQQQAKKKRKSRKKKSIIALMIHCTDLLNKHQCG